MNKNLIAFVALATLGAVLGVQYARKQTPPATSQFQPCVWPNRCATEQLALVPVTTCQWPNTCSKA